MLTREDIVAHCLTYPAAYEDYPFGAEWTVLRHRSNKKSFALIYDWPDGTVRINVKCEPERADFFRNVYPAVIPGYHMNKTHWNTIIIDGSMTNEEVFDLISDSYWLIAPKVRQKKAAKS